MVHIIIISITLLIFIRLIKFFFTDNIISKDSYSNLIFSFFIFFFNYQLINTEINL